MKTLQQFKPVCDPDHNPLFIAYRNVPFKELNTFELLRLLHSHRKATEEDTPYVKALKAELATRESLSDFERKAARK